MKTQTLLDLLGLREVGVDRARPHAYLTVNVAKLAAVPDNAGLDALARVGKLCYLGSTNGRKGEHYYGSGRALKSALRKYGRESFEVVVLAYADGEAGARLVEQRLINRWRAWESGLFYNVSDTATGGGLIAKMGAQTLNASMTLEQLRTNARKASQAAHAEKDADGKSIVARKASQASHVEKDEDGKSINARRAALVLSANLTPEQRSASARRAAQASATGRTPEQRSASVRRSNASRTPEQRSASARRSNASRTPEQRSAAARKANTTLTPEQRHERALKAAATLRARRAGGCVMTALTGGVARVARTTSTSRTWRASMSCASCSSNDATRPTC